MNIKLRNRLIALVCLMIFLGLGAFLFLAKSQRKPFAIILFVTDNLSPSTLTSARIFSGGGNGRLQMEELPNSALCRNAANDYSVPDSASASTAIAGGKRVNRASLCIDPSGVKLPSLLEAAAEKGRSTGLISSGEIIAPTSAAYFAKTLNAENRQDLLLQFCAHRPFDFMAGGGADIFGQSAPGTNSPSPLKQLEQKNVLVIRSMKDLEIQPFWKKVPILGLLAPGPMPLSSFGQGNPETPSLSDLVRVAITHLQSNNKGYLLVVDDPMIADAASSNNAETMFTRILALDEAVSTARRYAGEKALVLVAGRENLGGLQLNGYPFLRDKGVAILALNNQGYPSLCWSSGPGYSVETMEKAPARDHPGKSNSMPPGILTQPSAFPLPAALGTAGDVLSLGAGEGSQKLHGFLDLTDLHKIIIGAL